LTRGAFDRVGLEERYFTMSTLAEIEAALPNLSSEDLTKLEQTIRELLSKRDGPPGKSWRDIKPFNAGKMLKPLGPDDDILGEMIELKWPYPDQPAR
jgi:hypothetical protein